MKATIELTTKDMTDAIQAHLAMQGWTVLDVAFLTSGARVVAERVETQPLRTRVNLETTAQALRLTNNNVTEAASNLGISRATVYAHAKKAGISLKALKRGA